MTRLRGKRLPARLASAEKPRRKKTRAEANAMVTALVMKSRDAPPATSQRPSAIPIPTVHNGGIKAVAMATPGRAAERFGRVIAYAAARPPARAITRSMGVGRMRARISPGSSCNATKGRKRLTNAIKKESRMASPAPRKSAEADDSINLSSPMVEARPIPMIGDMSGASSMAPMITAGEFVTRPSVAMLHDNTTRR